MPVQTWEAALNAGAPYQTTDGAAYASSTSATDVSPGANIVLPANWYYPGMLFRWMAWGIYSNTGTPNLTLGVYYGGVAGSALAATAATATGSGVSNLMWRIEGTTRITTLGSSGSADSFGLCHGVAATASTPILMPVSSASGNAVTINTTTANAWTVGATWGTNSGSNTLKCYYFLLEQLT